MKKKILALFLAFVLSVGVSVTALADTVADKNTTENTSIGASLDGTTEPTAVFNTFYFAPTLKVTIGDVPDVIVNPFKMKYTGTAIGTITQTDTDSLISVPTTITNKSGVAVQVKIGVEGAPGANVTLSPSPVTGGSTKALHMFLEAKAAATATTDAEPTWSGTYTEGASMALVKSAEKTYATVKLTKAEGESTPTYAYFKIQGDSSADPDKPWTNTSEADKVNVKLTFTLTPVVS